jgi:hypothetical protein
VSEDLEKLRKEKFKEIIQREYIGCVFDVDGTLTVRGQGVIPAVLHGTLAKMCMLIPMAICSGRKLMSVYEKIAPVFGASGNPDYCQSNWIFLCENGSLGYYFDTAEKKYKEFFRVPYPYGEDHRERLFAELCHLLDGKTSHVCKDEIGLVFHPINPSDPDHAAAAARSHEIEKIIAAHLQKVDPKRLLAIGDSGIGCNVYPLYGDKENGLKEFGKFLHEKRGINLSNNLQELIVIGDRPQPNGNDETFLRAKFGTPFTVGEAHPTNLLPLPVYDESGTILYGPEGTAYILQNFKFKNT